MPSTTNRPAPVLPMMSCGSSSNTFRSARIIRAGLDGRLHHDGDSPYQQVVAEFRGATQHQGGLGGLPVVVGDVPVGGCPLTAKKDTVNAVS
ncbi:hypothetical protein [Actinocrispum sp. NPDC049592]|uniref:hypothetical protein n=1 Tax=Actinocrispum sp. NPDC049592 TaxID=3154835 RepID=UPI00342993BA